MTALAPNPIASILTANSISEDKALALIGTFAPFFAQAAELVAEAESIAVTDAGQKDQIAKARDLRLRVKRLRTTAESARKALKEESLRFGKAIDGSNGLLLEHILPVEAKLTEAEQFVERAEAARKDRLSRERGEVLRPYDSVRFAQPAFATVLGDMSQPEFDRLLDDAKLAHDARERREREEAEARAVKEAADKAERDRLAADNARLQAERAETDRIATLERELADAERREAEQKARAEREAAEAKLAAERAAHEMVLRKEREAREQLERDAAAQREAREKAEREAAEAKVRAEQAPDADKMDALAASLAAVQMPECTSRNARLAVGLIASDIEKLAEKCRQHALRLRS